MASAFDYPDQRRRASGARPSDRLTIAAAARGRRRRPWWGFHGIFGAFATAVLVLVALGGVLLIQRTPNNRGSLNAAGPAPTASPSTGCLIDQDQDTEPGRSAGINALPLAAISGGAQYADNVQLQGWAIDGGMSATIQAGPFGQFTGLAVDFVLQGFYSATFNGPGVVSTENLTGTPGIRLVDSGGTIELSHGDSVAFNYRDGITIQNISKTTPLMFKRALFTRGAAPSDVPGGDGYAVALEETAKLSASLDEMTVHSPIMIWLTYSQVQTSEGDPRAFCTETTRYRLLSTAETDRPANGEPNGYILYISRGGMG